MNWLLKKLEVPASNEMKEVTAVQLWEVRWTSRFGAYSGNTQDELEAFPTEEEAKEFATALRNAFKLIRHTSATEVHVKRAR